MHAPLKTAATIASLCGATLLCQAEEEFSLKHNLAAQAVVHFVGVKAKGIEILKNANDNRVLLQSTPAGKFAFVAGFPGITKQARMDSLLILDDNKDIKTFEHSFSCEDNGVKLEWVNVFKCHRDIPGVMIESRVINQAPELASCYQYWTTDAIKEVCFTDAGKNEIPDGLHQRLPAVDDWVFFQVSNQGGIGLIADSASGDWNLFTNFRNGKGIWGIRATTQGQSVFRKGQGSVLRFVLFFAVSPEKAKELHDKIKKENIFPELWKKEAH